MKIIALISLIAGCVLTCGPAYASGAPSPQQSTVPATAASDRSSNAERTPTSDESKNQKETTISDAQHHASDRMHPRSRAALPKTTNSKHVQHHRRIRPEDDSSMRQRVLTKPVGAPSKALNSHPSPVRPATGFAISGQQFRDGRNRNRISATVGGPANTKRSTVAINGTEVNRKRWN